MSNTLRTADWIVKEVGSIAHQNSNFLSKCYKAYNKEYTAQKIGATLRYRLPIQVAGRTGTFVQTVEDVVEPQDSIVMSSIAGADTALSSEDMTLSISNEEWSQRFLKPIGMKIASQMESTVLSAVYKQANNQVGTPGSAIASSKTIGSARQRIVEGLAPKIDYLNLHLSPNDMTNAVDVSKGLFNPQSQLEKSFLRGTMGQGQGFDFFENTLMPRHTVGVATGTPLMDGSTVTGATSIVTNGWTASQTGIVKAGDIITIDGVYAVHPETKATLSRLKQFVVQADANSGSGAGAATISILPAIVWVSGGAYNNVSALPANDAAITVAGTGGSTYGVSLGWHPESIALVTADLETPTTGVISSAKIVMDEVSISYVRAWDQANRRVTDRFDVLYGYKVTRADWVCRIAAD